VTRQLIAGTLVLSLIICAGFTPNAASQVPSAGLQALIQGSGSPLVMLGGGTAGAAEFEAPARVLADDYRVIRLETLNMERSQRHEPLPGGYSIRTESAAMARALDRLRIDRPVDLVGYSFGALVALDYALDHPHRVRTLTLMAPPALWVLPTPERRESEEMRTMYGLTHDVLSALVEHTDELDRLQRFQRPVLMITSAKTPPLQRRIDDLLTSHLPVVERLELRVGHGSPASAPDAFVAELMAFFARHRFN
jgi:pimeloyl-ACP methyl ester carboxylesterase